MDNVSFHLSTEEGNSEEVSVSLEGFETNLFHEVLSHFGRDPGFFNFSRYLYWWADAAACFIADHVSREPIAV